MTFVLNLSQLLSFPLVDLKDSNIFPIDCRDTWACTPLNLPK